jgi:hypothetical protein
MVRLSLLLATAILTASPPHAYAQAMPEHDHGIPENLGKVDFPISCAPAVQQPFNRAVALLHSFAYGPAAKAFKAVATTDPQCAMAHWGIAMTTFHPVWTPSLPPETFAAGQREMQEATRLAAPSAREQQYIKALGELYKEGPALTSADRTTAYEHAMAELAHNYPKDVEARVFYAVSILSNASPADKTHAKQKQAVDILEPMFAQYPDHPGIAHYLIHACDSTELAQRGLPAARKYASIAPSAPHALHMPSHIFTRLGLWDDSIHSNLASEKSAKEHDDVMGQLHAMDYLVYAYLQTGRIKEANDVVATMRAMPDLDMDDFAVAYAATAMPVRMAVEQGQWVVASAIKEPIGAPASVVAIAAWAKGLGLARSGHGSEASLQVNRLNGLANQLNASGDRYWGALTSVLADEVAAWVAQASGDVAKAEGLMRSAADREDALEKRPVTPGPVLPAREQLGELLLARGDRGRALVEFRAALVGAPGRRGALRGVALAGG